MLNILSEAKIGQRVRITNIHDQTIESLLLGLGIIPGDELTLLGKAPFGSPIALKHNAHHFLALRNHHANYIEVETLES